MEEIVYGRRTLGYLYIFFAVIFVALGLLFLMVALGMLVDKADRNVMGAVGFFAAGVSWLCGTPSMWSYWKGYRDNQVHIRGDEFSLCTPAGKSYTIPYRDIQSVTYIGNWRKRKLVIDTASDVFTFGFDVCPKTGTVAKLVAERSGHPLKQS